MIRLRTLTLLLSLALLSGCGMLHSVAQSGKLLAPESFGLIPIAPHLYVEAGTDEATRDRLREDMDRAEAAILKAYGSVSARPTVHACITEKCYADFGGRGSVARVFGQRILLSPRGLNWHFLAHEWSHAEMSTRLTLFAWKRMPSWFDEGLAVTISEAPEHSENHWQFLITANIPRPTRDELLTYQSLQHWLTAVHRFGDDKNFERVAQDQPTLSPVYAAAGHEVRPRLAQVGSPGLLHLIQRMNEGADFEAAYAPQTQIPSTPKPNSYPN
ncbi:MAG: hypothetical protein CFE39_02935 [Comamonadaceae bacterium PBBC2]|nr:MAG: hypothetical protein CFE39_02935 [Comamonadaceae bacterium PBBC2]